jgi:hypothetical protein
MSVAHRGLIPATHSLAQHLDTALAACDELLTRNEDPQSFLRLELTAITHVLQARQFAMETQLADGDLRRTLAYFVSQTDILEVAGSSQSKVAAPRQSDERLVGGRIALASLTALLASLLDAVDRQSSAEDDQPDDEITARSPPQFQEALVWATGVDAA